MHHILDESKTLDEVKQEIREQFALIDAVQEEIWHYLEWDMSFR